MPARWIAVRRAIVPGCRQNRDAEQSSVMKGRIKRQLALPGPLVLGIAPTDRDDGRFIDGIVNRRVDCVKEALIGIGSEINGDLRAWRNSCSNLDIEGDFAIGAVWIASR